MWVGTKERKWLDGRDVSRSEWHPAEPGGDIDECDRMSSNGVEYFLADNYCDNLYYTLCMRNGQ